MAERNILWAPWRRGYVLGKKEVNCVFCNKLSIGVGLDSKVLYIGENIFVIMNLYPYNSGHIMLLPKRHIAKVTDMTDLEMNEMGGLLKKSVGILQEVMSPDGFNIGYNMGAAAGAGIADHLHQHIVPRWSGDTNFMPVVGGTKVVSELLDDTYEKLIKRF